MFDSLFCVLIETLWNVNLHSASHCCPVLGRINRNIVECKYGSRVVKRTLPGVLIETLWNVNIPTAKDEGKILQY